MPTLTKTYSSTGVRSASRLEKHKAKAIAVASFAVVLVLAVATTLTVLALSGNKDNGPPAEVNAPVVFAVPVSNYTTMLKGYSATELQYNETMERWESHKAVDLQAELGAPVLATFGGTVASVADSAMFGRQVIIDHRDGLRTVYSNLAANVLVSQGDRVEKGQRVGSIGQTGSIEFTDTPHLRVQVFKDGKVVDPNDFIDFPAK